MIRFLLADGMALINCPECNGQISNYAHACPHCGFPNPANARVTAKAVIKPEESKSDKKTPKESVVHNSPYTPIVQMEKASFNMRLLAMGIDLLVCISIYRIGMELNLSNKSEEKFIFVALSYLLFRDSVGGRGIGKRITRLVLISEKTNLPIKPLLAVIRNLFILAPFIVGFIIILFFERFAPRWSAESNKIFVNTTAMGILAGFISAFIGRDAAFNLVGFKIEKRSI